ncbi:hypothetical protein BGZ98_006320 [Dissophora globulifera]|nr:hypothetical protein BGZ98_006320 [Dissophora globulifera]
MISLFSSTVFAVFASVTLLPSLAQGDIQCTQFGPDTFQVNSTIQFLWSDTGSVPIDTFNLNLICVENNKLIKTIATLNPATSVSPQTWVVDNTILATVSECSFNQYQGVFQWNYVDPTTSTAVTGSSACKNLLLTGPGVISYPGQPSDPFPTDEPTPSSIEISDRTKSIVIGVGCAVGVLIFAGFVGFYFVRYKNKRAEQELASRKLREPLRSNNGSQDGDEHDPTGATLTAGASARDFARTGTGVVSTPGGYNELTSVAIGVSGYSPLATRPSSPGEMVEIGGVPPSRSFNSSPRPGSFVSGSQPPLSMAAQHSSILGGQRPPRRSFISEERPPSILTSPFTPPDDDDYATFTQQQRRREEERLQYDQQLQQQQQQQQHHQQQQAHLQQQQQLQQLNYGSY